MIFLPNKSERFCFSLRNYIQRKTLISPINEKQRRILKKIYLAEALYFESQAVPVSIKDFIGGLLAAVQILKLEQNQKFGFSVNVKGNFLTDTKSLEALLLILSEKSRYIKIFTLNKKLVIEGEGYGDNITGLLKKLDAFCVYEIKNGIVYVIIPASETSKKGINTKREWELICDPFSCVNIFLSD